MNVSNLLTNPDVQKLILTPLLTFILGILSSFLIQIRQDRKQRQRITFSWKNEKALPLIKEELKNKISIAYQGINIEMIYFFHLKIANTGKKMIKDQKFKCQFAPKTESIDPSFPSIKTFSPSPTQVGPINLLNQTDTDYNYLIEKLNTGQRIEIDFLTINNSNEDLKVEFEPIEGTEYNEGEISTRIPTLENRIEKVVTNLIIFFVLTEISQIFAIFSPFSLVFRPIIVLIGIIYLVLALRPLPAIVTSIIAARQQSPRGHSATFSGGGFEGTLLIGDSSHIRITHAQDKLPSNAVIDSQPNPPAITQSSN